MTNIITLISSGPKKPLTQDHMQKATDIASKYGKISPDPVWLSPAHAVNIMVSIPHEPSASVVPPTLLELHKIIKAELEGDLIDVFLTSTENRRKKLLLADMDSTIVTGETLDDLANFAGIKDQITAITNRAMNGELDFEAALDERVGLLKGLPAQALEKALNQTKLSEGAKTLVQTMKKHGATCVLVSGGFTFFTGAIAQQVGFDHNHGNVLEIEDGALTGHVQKPVLDKNSKLEFLKYYCEKLNVMPADCLTIGDGANDLPMLLGAGLGIGYHAKPHVTNQIQNNIHFGDLTAALYAQGYTAKALNL